MRPVKRKRPRYLEMVVAKTREALATMGVFPGVLEVDIFHDDDCPALNAGGECACDADVGEVRQVLAPTDVQ